MARTPWLILLALLPATALASPWTLGKARGVVGVSSDVGLADREYLISGEFQKFPLRGRFFGANLRAGVRYGITNRLEIGGRLTLAHVSYEADEIFLGEPVTPAVGDLTDEGQLVDSLVSLDRRATGLGDVDLHVRFKITPLDLWQFSAAPELQLKIPTGYAQPQGTFADDGTNADDVTLGDGQFDATLRMHAGVIPHPRFFARGDIGYRLRLFGPGQQVVGGLRLGGKIGPFLIPYAGSDFEHTFTEGKVVGVSLTTTTPDKPARDFRASDLVATEYRLDRTALRPTAGLIFSFEKYELELAYAVTAWGRNVAQVHSIKLGAALKW